MSINDPSNFSSVSDALKHFGVKGMHWGIRKDGKPGSRKRAQSMTNEELNRDIARRKLEKKYMDLHSETREFSKQVTKDVAKLLIMTGARKLAKAIFHV